MKNMTNLPVKTDRFEIRLAGSGGQGVILAGIMLAEAATMDGKYASQSQTYGPEARGGSSRSDVVLSENEIDYPWSTEIDILVALTQQGCEQNLLNLKEDGMVIADSELVHSILWPKSISIPFQRIAREMGEPRAINMAALGAVLAVHGHISRDSIYKMMSKRLPAAKVEKSVQAFDAAYEAALSALILCTQSTESRDEIEI